MATSLILHKRITTTLAKAKALRIYVEPLITRSKEDTTHSRRMVFSYLQSKEAVSELFREISTKVADRPGGYTRIIKMPNRLGDNAQMCFIELVDFNELMLGEAKEAPKVAGKRKRRRGGGAAKKAAEKVEATPVVADEPVEEVTETVVEEVKEEVEETVAEVKEEPKVEEKVEEPVAEVKDEPKAEEPKAKVAGDEKAEDKKEETETEEDEKEKKAE
jgi:large subunit ribosomal protein L17